MSLDSCLVDNGQCDPNATCSHNATTNAVVCTCNIGFTDIGSGSGSDVRCIGMLLNRVAQIGLIDMFCEFR